MLSQIPCDRERGAGGVLFQGEEAGGSFMLLLQSSKRRASIESFGGRTTQMKTAATFAVTRSSRRQNSKRGGTKGWSWIVTSFSSRSLRRRESSQGVA